VMFTPLNEHASHRLAASAVVVDETTGGTFDFPGSNRNRSGSGVCCGLVAAFDGKAVPAVRRNRLGRSRVEEAASRTMIIRSHRGRRGCVGYEGDIITAELLQSRKGRELRA